MRLTTAAFFTAWVCLCMIGGVAQAQGLFENAGDSLAASAGKEQPKPFAIGGYVKGSLCGGQNTDGDAVVSAANAQLSLKLTVEKTGIGKAFSEIRLNAGKIRDSAAVSCDVREAWASVSPGPFDIKVGRQILQWGRADAINPTNTITPRDETVLSSEFDDTRLGNELLQAKATLGPANIQGLWIPLYRPDVLPLAGANIPQGITIGDPEYPDIKFQNGGFALRMELNLPAIDGSVSYFNGYATLPGFDYSMSQAGLTLIPRAYRMQAGGIDFSTVLWSVGLRGEAAVKYPYDDYNAEVYVPNPYAQYVVGIDKSIGDWNALVQYSGVYVFHFGSIVEPVLSNPYDPSAQAQYASDLAAGEIKRLNRMFTGTADEVSHTLTGNVQWNTLYETLHLKLACMYDITTKEYAINPGIAYDVADAIGVTVGGRYIAGPDGSLNDMVSKLLSFVYAEVKVSF